jgi:predicted nucleic-acid-binding Zn-ribbon protein
MQKCPECGSTEIVSDLMVFTDDKNVGLRVLNVAMVEPEPPKRPFVWMPQIITAGFRAAICGACGYTQFYTQKHAELLEARKKGYTSHRYLTQIIDKL